MINVYALKAFINQTVMILSMCIIKIFKQVI